MIGHRSADPVELTGPLGYRYNKYPKFAERMHEALVRPSPR